MGRKRPCPERQHARPCGSPVVLGVCPWIQGGCQRDGVEAEEALELSGEFLEFMGDGDADEDALV